MLERIDESTVRLTYRLPFSDGPPPVNLYLLEGEGAGDRPALVDTGPKDDRIARELEDDLAALGVALEDLADVVVTHHHVDHSGLAGLLAERSGARLHLHPDDIVRVVSDPERRALVLDELALALRHWGLPERVAAAVPDSFRSFFAYGSDLPAEAWTPLATDRPLEVAGRRLTAIHCPGHSAGQCVLWEPARAMLFAADHVLPDITSNPTYYVPAYRGRRTGLADQIESLAALRGLPATTILPGHGAPFTDLDGRIDAIRAEYEDRRRSLLATLASGRSTILDLVGTIWTLAELGPTHIFLACREVHGHLDILADEGLVEASTVDGVGWFCALAAAGERTERT